MKLADLDDTDRRIATTTGAVGAVVLGGLIFTGVWQFLFHDPDWDTYVVGVDRPLVADPVGMADAHQTFGDLTALLGLWTTAWLSYRVFAKVCMTGVAVLSLVLVGTVTGKLIRVNAVIRDGVTDTGATGYSQVFRGDFDYLVVGGADLKPFAAAAWTVAHLATVPLALVMIWVVFYRSRRRAQHQPAAAPSWLDQMGS